MIKTQKINDNIVGNIFVSTEFWFFESGNKMQTGDYKNILGSDYEV